MNRFARFAIMAVSALIVGWVGIGHVLGRTANDKAYKSLVVYSEVLQKIQQDYVDEPNMRLVTAGSLHGLLESLDSESSYLTPREYTEYKEKSGNPGMGESGLNRKSRTAQRRFSRIGLWFYHPRNVGRSGEESSRRSARHRCEGGSYSSRSRAA